MTESYKCPKCIDETLLRKFGLFICSNCDFQLPEKYIEPLTGGYNEGWGLEQSDNSQRSI